VFLSLSQRLTQIVIGRNVVSIEYGPRSMAADRHRDTFAHASADHVPDAAAPQVVKDTRRHHHDRLFSVDKFCYSLSHKEHPELARDVLAPMPRVDADELHRRLDEILAWKPHFAVYGGFKFMLLEWIGNTYEAMVNDRRP
jgi:hypothetical protein